VATLLQTTLKELESSSSVVLKLWYAYH